MSIRWIRTVLLDDEPSSLEVFMGQRTIADKCYVRYDGGEEIWFTPHSDDRDKILEQGKQLLKKKLSTHTITTMAGKPFEWK